MAILNLNGVDRKPTSLVKSSNPNTSPFAGGATPRAERPLLGMRALQVVGTPLRDPSVSDGLNPLNSLINTATLPKVRYVNNQRVNMQGSIPTVQPHERGTFFLGRYVATFRQAGGVDKNSDTPFHPANPAYQGPQPHQPLASHRIFAQSFASFNTLRFDPNNSTSSPRWQTRKTGAAG